MIFAENTCYLPKTLLILFSIFIHFFFEPLQTHNEISLLYLMRHKPLVLNHPIYFCADCDQPAAARRCACLGNIFCRNNALNLKCPTNRMSAMSDERMRKPWYWNDILYYIIGDGKEYRAQLKILHDFTKSVSLFSP